MNQDDPAERIRQGRKRAKEKTRGTAKEETKTSETSKTEKSSLKDTRTAVQIYIPDELKEEMEEKRIELQGKLGREIEKNRELWPLVIEKGLEHISEDDFKDGDNE
jgi:hypothetical protein